MPGPRHSTPDFGSPEDIVYREFGGPPPRLSTAASAAMPPRPPARSIDFPPLDAWRAVLPIVTVAVITADFALSLMEM